MFVRINSWQFWVCAIILGFFVMKAINSRPSKERDENVKIITASSATKVIEVNNANIVSSLSEVATALKNAKQNSEQEKIANTEKIVNAPSDRIAISYLLPGKKSKQVALCANSYVMHILAMNEEGGVVFSEANVPLSRFTSDKDLYNLLKHAFVLGSNGMKLEIFFNDGINAFKTLTGESVDTKLTGPLGKNKSMMLKIEVTSIVKKPNFDSSGIVSFILLETKKKKRDNIPFLCEETVVIDYSLFNLDGKLKKQETKVLTLGHGTSKQDHIFEYLVLNSVGGKIDAIIPYLKNRVIVKGQISKQEPKI